MANVYKQIYQCQSVCVCGGCMCVPLFYYYCYYYLGCHVTAHREWHCSSVNKNDSNNNNNNNKNFYLYESIDQSVSVCVIAQMCSLHKDLLFIILHTNTHTHTHRHT